jgi:hypothetical protein
LPFLYEGEVTRRDDPDGLGRVKIRIPGLIEPETPNWAFPMGGKGGGFAQHGDWQPPPVGATVEVLFKLGEPDHPRYLVGPWGDPDGVSDVPTNAAIDDDDGEPATRQNAVLEDEAWRIERDSRNGSGRAHHYLIRHKGSSLAVLIDAENDKIFVVRENADQAFVRGTEYRAAEVTYLGAMDVAIKAFALAMNSATTLSHVLTAGAALHTAMELISSAPFTTEATEYLSEKAFTE